MLTLILVLLILLVLSALVQVVTIDSVGSEGFAVAALWRNGVDLRGGGVLGGKLVGKLGSSKLPELELGLDLLFLLTTTRLGHPSFLPVPNWLLSGHAAAAVL